MNYGEVAAPSVAAPVAGGGLLAIGAPMYVAIGVSLAILSTGAYVAINARRRRQAESAKLDEAIRKA